MNFFKMFTCIALLALLALLAACNQTSIEEAEAPDAPSQYYNSYIQTEIEDAAAPVQTTGVLPSIYLSINANSIHRHDWRNSTVFMRNAGDYSFNQMTAQVRGRGNSTWRYMGDKRPFRVRLSQPMEMPGGSAPSTDWSFIANTIDMTLMRTYLAYYLGELLSGFDYSPTHSFVHVYMDGNYRGVYMISDQMHVANGRVEISHHPDPTLSEYFVQWCRHGRAPDDVYFRVGVHNTPFQLRYPSGRRLTDGHISFAHDFLYLVDNAMVRMDFDAITSLIDVPSFIDFYLVNEFFKNADVGFSSVFFTIRQTSTGPRLFAGPVWDFDQSAGGSYSPPWFADYSPRGAWVIHANHWLRNFIVIPALREQVADRWQEIRDVEIVQMIEHMEYISVRYAACFDRNFERWPHKLGNYVWRTPRTISAINTREEQVAHLADWFRQRAEWMDGFL